MKNQTSQTSQAQVDKIEKFNQWMLKIKSIYYADHKRMLIAYKKLV
jgi:hypothetical protein